MASLLSPILSVWISSERRRLIQVVPDPVRKVVDRWGLRISVLISFACQFYLLICGKRRKREIWVVKFVWYLYLTSEWVLNLSLGMISSKVGEQLVGENENKLALLAFWSTLLLVHFGGPPTITAEALEDNALWPRTVFSGILQTLRVLYIVLLAWRSKYWLSYFSIAMLLVGFIKCGERALAQYYANTDNVHDIKSINDNHLVGPNNSSDPNINNSEQLPVLRRRIHILGYLTGNHLSLTHFFEDLIGNQLKCFNSSASRRNMIIEPPTATTTVVERDPRDLFEDFKRLFVSLFKDLVMSSEDLEREQRYFRSLNFKRVFKYVEVQLGYAYDVLYTKAYVMFSPLGRILCVCTACIVNTTFICFCIARDVAMHGIPKADRVFTWFLAVGVVFQELYTVADQNRSNWNKLALADRYPLPNSDDFYNCGWLNKIRKCNFLSFSLQYDFDSWSLMDLKTILKIEECEVDDILRENIFDYYMKKSGSTLEGHGVNFAIEERGLRSIEWIKQLEFHQSILTWHIATNLCYHGINDVEGLSSTVKSKVDMTKNLSEYMLYLLVNQRHMLPIGRAVTTLPSTYKETSKFLRNSEVQAGRDGYMREACDKLLQFNLNVGSRGASTSALFDACRLARALINEMETMQRWEFLAVVWIEILGYAATRCRAEEHAQQLRRGGEFLTHVWLLSLILVSWNNFM